MPIKPSTYQTLVFVAYGFFILFGLVWFLSPLISNHKINFIALLIILVFGVQCYFKNNFANLIIGIITMFASIFSLLEFLSLAYNPLACILLCSMAVVSIIFSGILIFSYKKLNI